MDREYESLCEGKAIYTEWSWGTSMPSSPLRNGHLYGPQGHTFCTGNSQGDEKWKVKWVPVVDISKVSW